MEIEPFGLERYFAEHEFRVRHLLSASDCESMSMQALVALAGPAERALWDGLWLGYTESQGHAVLRKAIAGQYGAVGPDDVLVAAPEEAIFVAMNALLAAGDEVIVTWPAYQSLYEIATAIGCRIVRWPLAVRDGGWRLNLEDLARLITTRTRMIVVNFPHNPTGYLPDRATFDAIVEIARRHGLHLFSDEMYRLLELDPERRLPSGCDSYERGITLSGLSKAYGLPGLRIGWLATQDQAAMARFVRLKDYTTICSSAPSEVLGIMALRLADSIVARNLGNLRANLARAGEFFAATWAGCFEWLPPQAGSVAFPRLALDTPVAGFCGELLAARNTMLVPGDLFSVSGNHFRLGLGRAGFPAALDELGEFLEEWTERR